MIYYGIGMDYEMNRRVIITGFLFIWGTPCLASDTSGLIPFLAILIGFPSLVLTLTITFLIYRKVREKTVWFFAPFIFLLLCLVLYPIIYYLVFH